MIHEKIRGTITTINSLAGRVNEETWEHLKRVRAELGDAANMAEAMENTITAGQLAGAPEATHG